MFLKTEVKFMDKISLYVKSHYLVSCKFYKKNASANQCLLLLII